MVKNQNASVIGVFRDQTLAEQAIAELQHAGWSAEQLHLLGRPSGGILENLKSAFSDRDTTNTFTLDQLDLPEDQRSLYQQELDAGNFLVVADPQNRLLETRDLLHRYGAYNVFMPLGLGGEQVVPIREERASVEKRIVDVGEIRIHKRIITEQRTFTVPVTREEVTIERIPHQAATQQAPQFPSQTSAGDLQYDDTRPLASSSLPQNAATAAQPVPPSGYSSNAIPPTAQPVANAPLADEALRDGGTLRIFVREEQVFVNKVPVVVEEIVVHKQAQQEVRNLIEPVKHEEVRIEQHGNVPLYQRTPEAQANDQP